MAQGFLGKTAEQYFKTIQTAVNKASSLSGVPAGYIPEGAGGGYTLGVLNSSNVVVEDNVYNSGCVRMTQTDELIAERIMYIIKQLEEACDTIFIVPETTAKVKAVLDEIKTKISGFTEFTTEGDKITRMFLSNMSGLDSGDKRVYNESSIGQHRGTCEREINNQIKGLKENLAELKAELAKAQAELASAKSALAAARSALASASRSSDEDDRSNIASLQRKVSSLSSQVASLEAKIILLKEEIKKVEECIEYLQDTLSETRELIDNLVSDVHTVDENYALSLEALNDWTREYINSINAIGDSIGTPASLGTSDVNGMDISGMTEEELRVYIGMLIARMLVEQNAENAMELAKKIAEIIASSGLNISAGENVFKTEFYIGDTKVIYSIDVALKSNNPDAIAGLKASIEEQLMKLSLAVEQSGIITAISFDGINFGVEVDGGSVVIDWGKYMLLNIFDVTFESKKETDLTSVSASIELEKPMEKPKPQPDTVPLPLEVAAKLAAIGIAVGAALEAAAKTATAIASGIFFGPIANLRQQMSYMESTRDSIVAEQDSSNEENEKGK